MWEDPIVAEVHRIRCELAEKFDFDLMAIVADIRQRQTALGSRLVSRNQMPGESTAETDRVHVDNLSGGPSESAPAA